MREVDDDRRESLSYSVPRLFCEGMGSKRLDSFFDCERHGLGIHVQCLGCGRIAIFSAGALFKHFLDRRRSSMLDQAGRFFVCRGAGAIAGCGHRGVRLRPCEPPAPRKAPPAAVAERVPIGVDPDAWARADDRERKRLIRRARG